MNSNGHATETQDLVAQFARRCISEALERPTQPINQSAALQIYQAIVNEIVDIGVDGFGKKAALNHGDPDAWPDTARYAVFAQMILSDSPHLRGPVMDAVIYEFLGSYRRNDVVFDLEDERNDALDAIDRNKSNALFRLAFPGIFAPYDDELSLRDILNHVRWSLVISLLKHGFCFLAFIFDNRLRLRLRMKQFYPFAQQGTLAYIVDQMDHSDQKRAMAAVHQTAVLFLYEACVPESQVWLRLFCHRNFDTDLLYPFDHHLGHDVLEMVMRNTDRTVASILFLLFHSKVIHPQRRVEDYLIMVFDDIRARPDSFFLDVYLLEKLDDKRVASHSILSMLCERGSKYTLRVAEAFYGKQSFENAMVQHHRDHHRGASVHSAECLQYLMEATRNFKERQLIMLRDLNARRTADREEAWRRREKLARALEETERRAREEERERKERAEREAEERAAKEAAKRAAKEAEERERKERAERAAEERAARRAAKEAEERLAEKAFKRMESVRALNRRRFFETREALQQRDKAAAAEDRADKARRAAQAKVDAANAKAKRQEEERQRQRRKDGERTPALRHSPPTQALLSMHLLRRGAREDDVVSVAASVATTAVPLPVPTHHYGERKEERMPLFARPNVDHEVKWSIKHGVVEQGRSPGTLLHRGREGGVDVVTTVDAKVGITLWPALPSSVTSSDRSPVSSPSSASTPFTPPPPPPPRSSPNTTSVHVRTCLSCDQRVSSDVCLSCFAMCACFVCAQSIRTCLVCGEDGVRFRHVRLEW